MKRFLKRRLPALMLSAVLVLSLMPTALAADCGHNSWGAWQKLNDQQHQPMRPTVLLTGKSARTAAHRPPMKPTNTAAA